MAEPEVSPTDSSTASQQRPTHRLLDVTALVDLVDNGNNQFLRDNEVLLVENIVQIRRQIANNVRGRLQIQLQPVGDAIEPPPNNGPCSFELRGVLADQNQFEIQADYAENTIIQNALQQIRNLPIVDTLQFSTRVLSDEEVQEREMRINVLPKNGNVKFFKASYKIMM